MSKKNASKQPAKPVLVVYGIDDAGKHRAAAFDAVQASSAKKLAGRLNFQLLDVTTSEQETAADKLEWGKLFLNGKGAIPIVDRPLFDRIAELAAAAKGASLPSTAEASGDRSADTTAGKGQAPTVPATSPVSAPAPQIKGLPSSWDGIEAGHVVVAQSSAEEGWWEAIVLEQSQDLFTLRWRDYPKYPNFVRHRSALALICPPALT